MCYKTHKLYHDRYMTHCNVNNKINKLHIFYVFVPCNVTQVCDVNQHMHNFKSMF
jgi:hypothetical protein